MPFSFDQKIKDNIKGQAYFLRALAYFDLVQYFGSVPIHLKPAKTQADTSQPLASVEDVYKQIIADAGQAVSHFCHPKRIKSLVGQRRERQTLFWVMYI